MKPLEQPIDRLDAEIIDTILEEMGDDLAAARNLQVVGERLCADAEEVDVDARWKAFAARHQSPAGVNEDSTEDNSTTIADAPRNPRWLRLTRYVLMAAAVVAIIVGVALPKTEDAAKEQLAKAAKMPEVVYVADPQPAPVQLAKADGEKVELTAASEEHLDALEMASAETESMTITIPKGKTYRVDLADGTKVYMNADSRLTFPTAFIGDKRTVELEGEAYFAVARDEDHPFVVRTRGMETTVLGTEFYVRSDKGQPAQVTLVSGRVRVDAGSQHAELTPGMQTTVSEGRMVTQRGVDTDRYRYWRDGLLYFDNVDLLDVLQEIGRTYNCNVELEDADLRNLKIHFVADRNLSIAEIAKMICQMERVKASVQGDKLVVASDSTISKNTP